MLNLAPVRKEMKSKVISHNLNVKLRTASFFLKKGLFSMLFDMIFVQ